MTKILITGAGGFIGSHLTELLVKEGYHVKAFIRYNSRNNWGWLENSEVKNDVEVFLGDIRDYDTVLNAMRECNAVFHLAALIGIPYSYISPLAYIKTNIEGTNNVLQASKENKLSNILVTSTSETYGTAQYIPINEKHPLVGQSPYSASKIGADQLALSYFYSFDLPIKVVRPFNTYGPRQSARAIIPTVITQILNGEEKIRLGNLNPTRDLTFVKDTVKGFLEIARTDKTIGQVTNIGMNNEISIGELVAIISELMNADIKILSDKQRVRPTNSEVERLLCENTKIKQITNWQPQYNLEKGLKETVAWLKDNIHLYKPKIYNV